MSSSTSRRTRGRPRSGSNTCSGSSTIETASPRYLDIWATSQEAEKAAFERFIDLVIDRLDAHPEMHVYHYGGYEAGAIKRLMQRHGTCVDEVDRLLRGDVLVDLLNAVRQGVRASVESYSLKQIEKFYMPKREGPVTRPVSASSPSRRG